MTLKLSRREFLEVVGLGAASVIVPGCTGSMRSTIRKRPRSKPNIVFIMADDLGYGDLGCYGQKLIQTPCIDRMAKEGMRFTQCYAGSCVCAPSRSVLMTGQHTGHTRVRDNHCEVGGVPDELSGNGCRLPLKNEDVTVAEVLKRAGYAIGVTGKWGLGEAGTSGIPTRQGFDEWFGYHNQDHAADYFTEYLWRNEEKATLQGNRNGRREQYTHDLFTEFAVDFISRHKEEPFFLYVAYTIPHLELEVPNTEPYTNKPWPQKAKTFAAMVTRMDRDVGRILHSLSEHSIANNTIVFFCSDNGAAGKVGPIFDSNGPLKGGKGELDEGGIRTPMIVWWPGKVPAGKVCDAPWYYADVMPTLAELAGVSPPDNIDGVSVLPTLLGHKQNLGNRFMYWEEPPPNLHQVLRWRNWKARRRKPGFPLELYDLAKDIKEQHNVAARHPDVVAVLETYLKTARTESPNWPSR